MQTFASLCTELAGLGRPMRVEPHVFTVEIEGHAVELFRIVVGGAEWAAISVMLGPTALARHDGLGALVRCRDGWVLRLTLPVAEVRASTVAETMQRLAYEAITIRRELQTVADPAPLQMWAE